MAPMAEKEWTLMFYFASDGPLAPDIVTQLKALKQAGFHPDANVIAQFDPHPENADTHIFDVNRINKIQAPRDQPSKIGFIGIKPNDPYVVNLMTDKLWRNDLKEGRIRQRIIDSLKRRVYDAGRGGAAAGGVFEFDPPVPPPSFEKEGEAKAKEGEAKAEGPDILKPQAFSANSMLKASMELAPRKSLSSFLKFCSENYPARHYMLFVLGHGLVVGNDTFLLDENAAGEQFLSLQTLGVILEEFKTDIKKTNADAEFELISFHSCSMSSVEVAFELQGVANYMLASQSPSFVGSWPYRQILIRIFNYLDRKEGDVKKLLRNIFHYCLYQSIDYLVAGYSCDGGLCDLNKVSDLEEPISDLSAKLIKGLNAPDPRTQALARERILLAHLDAQSYFNENYSDIYDFCFRLQQRLHSTPHESLPTELKDIHKACHVVLEVLRKGVEGDDDRLIVRSDFVGPAYQYSHGLSIYFPWFKPIKSQFWPQEYDEYKFVKAIQALEKPEKKTWSDFLLTYFETTRRHTRVAEFEEALKLAEEKDLTEAGFKNELRPRGPVGLQADLLEAFSTVVFNSDGQLTKPGPDSSQGAGCECQSVKNYPPFTRESQEEPLAGEDASIPTSVTLLNDSSFKPEADEPTFALDGIIE